MKVSAQKYASTQRASTMMESIFNGTTKQHLIINSANDFMEVQDLYLNSYYEWLKSPNAQNVLNIEEKTYNG